MEKIHCKHCGTRIDSDSRYCSACGGKLTKENTKIVQPTKTYNTDIQFTNEEISPVGFRVFGYEIPKILIGINLLWFLVHFIIYMVNYGVDSRASEYFYPFSLRSEISHYDLSEFLVYTVAPVIITLVVILLTSSGKPDVDKYEIDFKPYYSLIGIGILLLIINIILYNHFASIPVGTSKDEAFNTAGMIQILIRLPVALISANIAGMLNRSEVAWGVTALLFPVLTLLLLGSKRKLKDEH